MRLVVGIALVSAELCIVGSLVDAQGPGRGSRAPTAAASSVVRAELATVLLQSGRYDEAAREFRVLLARDPSNFDHRLAFAPGHRPPPRSRDLAAGVGGRICRRGRSPGRRRETAYCARLRSR